THQIGAAVAHPALSREERQTRMLPEPSPWLEPHTVERISDILGRPLRPEQSAQSGEAPVIRRSRTSGASIRALCPLLTAPASVPPFPFDSQNRTRSRGVTRHSS